MALNALKDIIDEGGREDREIAKEEPLVVKVGGRQIYIRAFTLDNYVRWLGDLGTMLHQFQKLLETLEWPETQKGLDRVRQSWMVLMSQRGVYETLIRMVCRTIFREPGNGWWRWHGGFFRKRVTVQELMDLFFYAYLFNHEAVKKNATFLLKKMGFVRHRATFLSSSAGNLAGVSGAQVKPRYPVSPFSRVEKPSSNPSNLKRPVAPVIPMPGGGGR